MKNTFKNPILSGFYPDPSICRVGDDYYMVTSSFVYFPALPIFHSKDLIHWEQIGHAIDRVNQLDFKNCETSLGLWAPSIRYNNGTFYIINTFVSEGREARRDNYIITAKDPRGDWSNPIFIEGSDGIDSSLFFDDDGSIWYVGNYICSEPLYEGHHGIYLNELDKDTFQFKGERYIIWNGNKTRSKWIEAPHIYKKDGYYYLLVAEGGTFTNHSVMMARCKEINGDYEICPRNPIVSHRHLSLMHEISVVGHADIVKTQNDEWYMVLLGIRPYEGFHFNLGRETFLVPIKWQEDGWPLLDNENGLVNTYERKPNLKEHIYPLASTNDNFECDKLAMMWNTIHPPVNAFYSLSERHGFLRLKLIKEVMHEICTPAFVGRRQQHKTFLATCAMEFNAQTENEQAGLCAEQDDRFHYCLVKGLKNNKPILTLYKTENSKITVLAETELLNDKRLYLSIQGNETEYRFYYGYNEHEKIQIGNALEAKLLSSNVNEGFTGAYIGMYATANGQNSENYADFDWFNYQGLD